MSQSSLLRRVSSLLSRHTFMQSPFMSSSIYNVTTSSNCINALQTRNFSKISFNGNDWNMETLRQVEKQTHRKQSLTIDQLWHSASTESLNKAKVNPPKDAYSGRSVSVRNGKVAEGMRTLDNILSRNKVRYEVRMTRRHEKKGVKRRRLSSERWRKQFANEVRKKVQLVTKMRNRGA